jgi:hypothetical protein
MDMKNLIFLFFLFQGSVAFSQIKFENKKLALIYDIFYKTTRGNVDSFMKDKGFKKGEVDKGYDDDTNEIFTFSSQFDLVGVNYNKQNKTTGVSCIYAGAPNNVFIEMELKDKGYKAKIIKEDVDGETMTTRVWSIQGSKLNFVTSANEKEKSGTVGYGVYEE